MGSKRVIAVLIGMFILLVAAGCGSDDDGTSAGGDGTTAAEESGESYEIAYIGTTDNPFSKVEIDTLREKIEAAGSSLTVFDHEFDQQKEFRIVQDAVSQGQVDGIIIVAASQAGVVPLIPRAVDADIPVVAMNTVIGESLTSHEPQVEGLAGTVLVPAGTRGEWLAEQVIDACEGLDPCRVGYIAGVAEIPFEVAIKEGFEAGIEGQENIDLVAYADGGQFQKGPAIKITQDMLQAHPDINLIAAVDQSLLGSEIAIRDAGRTVGTGEGDIRLVGIGATEQGIEAVREGRWVSVQASLPVEEAEFAWDLLRQALDGELEEPVGLNPATAADIPGILDKEAIEATGFEGEFSG